MLVVLLSISDLYNLVYCVSLSGVEPRLFCVGTSQLFCVMSVDYGLFCVSMNCSPSVIQCQ